MKTITRLAGTALAVLGLTLATANPAGASHVTGWGMPSRSGQTINAAVWGDTNCQFYQCAWHVTIERSSWSGYRTMDESRRDMYFGGLSAACMEGTYNYHAHWHEERIVQGYEEIHFGGAGYGHNTYEPGPPVKQDSPSVRITCHVPAPGVPGGGGGGGGKLPIIGATQVP